MCQIDISLWHCLIQLDTVCYIKLSRENKAQEINREVQEKEVGLAIGGLVKPLCITLDAAHFSRMGSAAASDDMVLGLWCPGF